MASQNRSQIFSYLFLNLECSKQIVDTLIINAPWLFLKQLLHDAASDLLKWFSTEQYSKADVPYAVSMSMGRHIIRFVPVQVGKYFDIYIGYGYESCFYRRPGYRLCIRNPTALISELEMNVYSEMRENILYYHYSSE